MFKRRWIQYKWGKDFERKESIDISSLAVSRSFIFKCLEIWIDGQYFKIDERQLIKKFYHVDILGLTHISRKSLRKAKKLRVKLQKDINKINKSCDLNRFEKSIQRNQCFEDFYEEMYSFVNAEDIDLVFSKSEEHLKDPDTEFFSGTMFKRKEIGTLYGIHAWNESTNVTIFFSFEDQQLYLHPSDAKSNVEYRTTLSPSPEEADDLNDFGNIL